MMRSLVGTLLSCLSVVPLCGAMIHAQTSPAYTVELAIGSARGSGGQFKSRSRDGVAFGTQLDFLQSPNKSSSFGFALRFDLMGSLGSGDDCEVGLAGDCLDKYPFFVAAGVGPLWSLHGPLLLRLDVSGGLGDYIEMDDFSQNVGAFAQIRAAGPHDSRFGFVLRLTMHFVPNARRNALVVRTLTAGFRVGF